MNIQSKAINYSQCPANGTYGNMLKIIVITQDYYLQALLFLPWGIGILHSFLKPLHPFSSLSLSLPSLAVYSK